MIRAALASRPDVATPPGGDWSGFTARLDYALVAERGTTTSAPGSAAGVMPIPLRRRLAPYLAMAALLALVTVSVLLVIGQRGGAPADSTTVGRALPPSTPRPPAGTDPALVALTGQHFQRSKLVVLGLTTKDTGGDDWAYERELAAKLLGDTRVYRLAAEERGMQTLAGVMRDLELVLLQTSMSEEPDDASLEQLQRLIRRRDLVAKMNAAYGGS